MISYYRLVPHAASKSATRPPHDPAQALGTNRAPDVAGLAGNYFADCMALSEVHK